MRKKTVAAAFKCVLVVLACLTVGACKPKLAKQAFTAAEKAFSSGGSKAERFAQRAAANGVNMPHLSGGSIGGAASHMGGGSQNWSDVGKAAGYVYTHQRSYQQPCLTCGGTGQVTQLTGYDCFGNPVFGWVPCPSCR